MKTRSKVFTVDRENAVDVLLRSYQAYYNIYRYDGGENAVREGSPEDGKSQEEMLQLIEEKGYPLKARCDFFEHSQKYMISRKAEMYHYDSEEFLYLFSTPVLTMEEFEKCKDLVLEDSMDRAHIGPGHMYTFATAIFLCDSCDEEVLKALKKIRFYKSFRFSLHGWLDYHNAVAIFGNNTVGSNYAGKSSAKILKKILIHNRRVK